jgi:hypothetical protein
MSTNRRYRAATSFQCQKQPASSCRGMVVSNHPLASSAGAESTLSTRYYVVGNLLAFLQCLQSCSSFFSSILLMTYRENGPRCR